MGGHSSRYETLGEETYAFNNKGAINVSGLQTGDLIFFSKEFPTSSLHRFTRRLRSKLWTNCGMVLVLPGAFPNQTLLLESATLHPDDHIQSKFGLKTVSTGPRVCNLAERLSSQTFAAIAIRRRVRTFNDKELEDKFVTFDASNQWQTVSRLKGIIEGTTETDEHNLALSALKSLKIIFAPYAKLSLNDLAGSPLNRYCQSNNQYGKTEIFAWPTEKTQRKFIEQ